MPDGLEVLQFGLFEGYWCCGPAQVNAGRSALAKQLAALAACMWLFSSCGPASAEEITPKEDTATDQAQEQWTFALCLSLGLRLPKGIMAKLALQAKLCGHVYLMHRLEVEDQ